MGVYYYLTWRGVNCAQDDVMAVSRMFYVWGAAFVNIFVARLCFRIWKISTIYRLVWSCGTR